jgi:hypothetical protein
VLLRQVLDEARSERIVHVDHMIGWGRQLFEAVQQIGAEGIARTAPPSERSLCGGSRVRLSSRGSTRTRYRRSKCSAG